MNSAQKTNENSGTQIKKELDVCSTDNNEDMSGSGSINRGNYLEPTNKDLDIDYSSGQSTHHEDATPDPQKAEFGLLC